MRELLYLAAAILSLAAVRGQTEEKKVICYYINWSTEERDGNAAMQPNDVDPFICTHVIYAFARIDLNDGVVPTDESFDIEKGGYEKIVSLKSKNPNLKVLLAVGGLLQGSVEFSKITSTQPSRAKLIQSIIQVLRQYDFDGVNFDWQYPADEGGSPEDFHNFGNLTQELRSEIENEALSSPKPRLLMSILVTNIAEILLRGYKLEVLSKHADFLVLMALYHTPDEGMTNHIAPLYSLPTDYLPEFNVDGVIRLLLRRGVPPEKLVLGITSYGSVYRLANATINGFGSPALDSPTSGMGYWKLCQIEQGKGWTKRSPHPDLAGPYIYKDRTWIPYDDPDMVKRKAEYAASKNLGGIWFWALNYMDHMGLCNGKPYPLIQAAREGLRMRRMAMKPPPIRVNNKNPFMSPMDGMNSEKAMAMEEMNEIMKMDDKKMNKKRVVCYFQSDSFDGDDEHLLKPEDVDPDACTHIIYAHADIALGRGVIVKDSTNDIKRGTYQKLVNLKRRNPKLKVLLSVGGPGKGRIFSQTSKSLSGISNFIQSAVKFLRQYRFDGIDIDWRDTSPSDRGAYTNLIEGLMTEFENEAMDTNTKRLLLSITVPSNVEVIKTSYNLKYQAKFVDFMNLLAFDYHSADLGSVTSHNAPLYTLPFDIVPNHSIDNLVNLILSLGVSPNKLNLGIYAKATEYTLVDETMNTFNSPANADNIETESLFPFSEVCKTLLYEKGWTFRRPYQNSAGPYVYKGNKWLSFDDPVMVMVKAAYIANKKLGGIMFWGLQDMDHEGICLNKTYPLIRAAKETLGLRWNNTVIAMESTNHDMVMKSMEVKPQKRKDFPRPTAIPQRNFEMEDLMWRKASPEPFEPPSSPAKGSTINVNSTQNFTINNYNINIQNNHYGSKKV